MKVILSSITLMVRGGSAALRERRVTVGMSRCLDTDSRAIVGVTPRRALIDETCRQAAAASVSVWFTKWIATAHEI